MIYISDNRREWKFFKKTVFLQLLEIDFFDNVIDFTSLHTDISRQEEDCPYEVFASKHKDHTSVDEGVVLPCNIVPERKDDYPQAILLPSCQVDCVFLCRKVQNYAEKLRLPWGENDT